MKINSFFKIFFGIFAFLAIFQTAKFSLASSSSSTNFGIDNPVITSGQQSSSSTTFRVGQSISPSVTGKASSTSFQLWSGFQYFFKANSNTLTASPGNSQVGLSWNVPQTFLGITVGTYELGVGTVSGSYAYENVGNVTNFTKSGLTNGTQYFFKIKSKTLAGTVLTYSNETSATPTGSTPTPTPPGGGGGGGDYDKIIFSGYSYPGSQIFLLKDASLIGNTAADAEGNFQITAEGLSFGFGLYAKDAQGRRSPLVPLTVNLASQQTKNISGIILPPTIAENNIEIKKGEALNVFGFAQKQSKVTIYLSTNTGPQNFETQAGPEGFYNLNIPTAKLNFGTYNIFAKSFYKNLLSLPSLTLEFKVGEKTVQSPAIGCPVQGDLNGDCRVNLVDFSILAYWYLKNDFPKEVDFNNDGIVDLVDFSILAYNFTG